MKHLIVVISFLFAGLSFGQNIYWAKSFGNTGYDVGKDVLQTPDTGYICTGSSSSFNSSADAYLMKLDSMGNLIWSYNYGESYSESGEALVITNDSAFAIGGFSNDPIGSGGFDFYLVKTNILGVPQWEKRFGGPDWDKCYDVEQLPDSGFVLVGETYSYGAGNKDGYIVRTDKNGDTLWTAVFGGVDNDYFTSCLFDGDSLVVVGSTESFGPGMQDGWIIKMDTLGNVGWEQYPGRPWMDYFNSITHHNSKYYLGGTRTINGGVELNDFWIYEMSMDGLTLFADTSWGGMQVGHDEVFDIEVENGNNDIYYLGTTTSWGAPDVVDGIPDAFLGKFSPLYFWIPHVQNFGTIGKEALYAGDLCYDNGIVMIGETKAYSTGGTNTLVVRIDKAVSYPSGSAVTNDIILDSITNSIPENIEDFNIYPNPVDDIVHLSKAVENIKIFDFSGKEVQFIQNSTYQIDLSSLPSGIYLLTFSKEERLYSRKLVKN